MLICGLPNSRQVLTAEVVTFGEDNPDGAPAQHFYQQLGFTPAEDFGELSRAAGPEGGSHKVFRRVLDATGRLPL